MIDINAYIQEIHKFYDPNHMRHAGVLASLVLVPDHSGKWLITTGCMRYSTVIIVPAPSRAYQNLLLWEEWIPSAEFYRKLEMLNNGQFSVNYSPCSTKLESYEVSRRPSTRYFQKKASFTTHSISGWSEVVGCFRLTNESHGMNYGPYIKKGLPPILNAYEAVAEWVWKGTDPEKGRGLDWKDRLYHVWPDERARIKSATWVGNQVTLISEIKDDYRQYEYQATMTSVHDVKSTGNYQIEGASTHIPITSDLNEINMILADSNGQRMSDIVLTHDGDTYDVDAITFTSQRQVALDLSAGENKWIEFKEYYITDDNRKAERLIRTVVAFANQQRGRIYLGVDDEGVPVGNAELRKVAPDQDLSACINKIKKWIESQIIDKVKPTPTFITEAVQLGESTVILVEVHAGQHPRYSTYKNEIYIRRGSTSRMADPYVDLPMLFSSRPDER